MPTPIKVTIGKVFGRLTILNEVPSINSVRRVRCRCSCGNVACYNFKSLRNGNTSSCGCLRREMVAAKNTTHGLSTRPEYTHWKAMRQRCNDPGCEKFPTYGGVGIIVCARWNNFALFLEDVGEMPSPTHTLDRFPNRQGNYEPGNVRWATASEQMRNRDCMDTVIYKGVKWLIIDLAESVGLTAGRLRWRLAKGWNIEKALTMPARLGNNQHV